ncbi:MAG: acetyltransferase [Deltaproteobacteria bacterium]|nr:acetyltransferase [Deltaproteobacteria bacterium]MBW1909654.1 acetyltransferase [Deltaproteobacteria bacterium]
MIDLLIFPFGGNSRETLLAIQAQNMLNPTWNVIGFIDDNEQLWEQSFCGVRVLGGRSAIHDFSSAQILAVPGNPENFYKRADIIGLLDIPLDRYATVVDPSARISVDAKIGKNTVLMANVVISCSVEIGNHCVILPNTVISHDSVVGDYCCIGSNVSVSGYVSIGTGCYIGSGARIMDHLRISSGCLVGIGSCVIQDVPPNIIMAGNPARHVRKVR